MSTANDKRPPGVTEVKKKKKNSPANVGVIRRQMWVQSLGQEDPLEQEMATHSNIRKKKMKTWDKIR